MSPSPEDNAGERIVCSSIQCISTTGHRLFKRVILHKLCIIRFNLRMFYKRQKFGQLVALPRPIAGINETHFYLVASYSGRTSVLGRRTFS